MSPSADASWLESTWGTHAGAHDWVVLPETIEST
jgi:hypothetical protein